MLIGIKFNISVGVCLGSSTCSITFKILLCSSVCTNCVGPLHHMWCNMALEMAGGIHSTDQVKYIYPIVEIYPMAFSH